MRGRRGQCKNCSKKFDLISIITIQPRRGTVIRNGPSTQGRLDNRLLREPNRRTQGRVLETILVLPPTPPDKAEVPRTRNVGTPEKICCSDYDEHRKEMYPRYFFCENYVFYDADSKDPTRMNLVKRNSRKYRCRHS